MLECSVTNSTVFPLYVLSGVEKDRMDLSPPANWCTCRPPQTPSPGELGVMGEYARATSHTEASLYTSAFSTLCSAVHLGLGWVQALVGGGGVAQGAAWILLAWGGLRQLQDAYSSISSASACISVPVHERLTLSARVASTLV